MADSEAAPAPAEETPAPAAGKGKGKGPPAKGKGKAPPPSPADAPTADAGGTTTEAPSVAEGASPAKGKGKGPAKGKGKDPPTPAPAAAGAPSPMELLERIRAAAGPPAAPPTEPGAAAAPAAAPPADGSAPAESGPPAGKGKAPPPKGKGKGPPPPAAAAAAPDAAAPAEAPEASSSVPPSEESPPAAEKGKGGPPAKGKGKGGPAASPGKGGGKTMSYKEKQEAAAREMEDTLSAEQNFKGKDAAAFTSEENDIINGKATEAAGTGEYNTFQPTKGYFGCKKCGRAIYSFEAKFESGCGWPAFDKCFAGAITAQLEDDGSNRVEIVCSGCAAHLGHVFLEPGHKSRARTDQRHCANSRALQYIKHAPPEGTKLEEEILVCPEVPAESDTPQKVVTDAKPTLELETQGDGSTFPKEGDTVTIHYTGKLQSTLAEFDSSAGGDAFQFVVGAGAVIAGWDMGVKGMPLGSTGKLSVPAVLGYGHKGMGSAIPPGADLLFYVTLVSVNGQTPAPAAPPKRTSVRRVSLVSTSDAAVVKPSASSRFRPAVRKVMMMRNAAAAFNKHQASAGFTAASAVGELEASLAEEEEYALIMRKRDGQRGRTGTISAAALGVTLEALDALDGSDDDEDILAPGASFGAKIGALALTSGGSAPVGRSRAATTFDAKKIAQMLDEDDDDEESSQVLEKPAQRKKKRAVTMGAPKAFKSAINDSLFDALLPEKVQELPAAPWAPREPWKPPIVPRVESVCTRMVQSTAATTECTTWTGYAPQANPQWEFLDALQDFKSCVGQMLAAAKDPKTSEEKAAKLRAALGEMLGGASEVANGFGIDDSYVTHTGRWHG